MIGLVKGILKETGLPVEYMIRPDLQNYDTVISFHFYNEGYLLYADGWGIEEGGAVQVDIFSIDDYSETVRQIKNLMRSARFRLVDARDMEDAMGNLEIYHKLLIFNFLESEVLKHGFIHD